MPSGFTKKHLERVAAGVCVECAGLPLRVYRGKITKLCERCAEGKAKEQRHLYAERRKKQQPAMRKPVPHQKTSKISPAEAVQSLIAKHAALPNGETILRRAGKIVEVHLAATRKQQTPAENWARVWIEAFEVAMLEMEMPTEVATPFAEHEQRRYPQYIAPRFDLL